MPYFLDFLSKHGQSHLLLFWLEVEVFELAAGGGPSLVTQATRIYESYLGEGAPKRIDVPDVMLTFLEGEITSGAPNINVFAAVHAFVFRRLHQTWYPAFLLSTTYRSLLVHLKNSFRTPLKEVLLDEVQSRYIEAFLLNSTSPTGPCTVGNVYLWKKIQHDLRPLGARLSRDRLVGPAGDARNANDLRTFIMDAKAVYEAYIQPSPQVGVSGGPSLSSRSFSGQGYEGGGRQRDAPSATALGPELRYSIAECLGRLASQSRYYSGVGTGGIGQIDRSIIGELNTYLIEAQRVILAWLEAEVYPSFLESNLVGILSGEIQSQRSAPLRRKKRLRTLFKSVRSFRHVYVPPCPRSEGRGLVLVSTEDVFRKPEPLTHEFVWGFDVAVFPVDLTAGRALRAADLRTDVGRRESEVDGEGGEKEDAGVRSPGGEESNGAVGGAILCSKNEDGNSGFFHLDEPVPNSKGTSLGQEQEQGHRKKFKRPLHFSSAVRSSQVLGLPKPSVYESNDVAGADTATENEEDVATSLCASIETRLVREIQRLAFPSLCLMPLERSTFVLFSPKLVVPEATLHHFVLPISRKDVDPELRRDIGSADGRDLASSLGNRSPSPFVASPRVAVRSPSGEGELAPPDLKADQSIDLYGACLMEWAPAGADVLLPRCVVLVSTEPRVASLRRAVVRMRESMGQPGVGGSPIMPDTPKKTPWQLEDEQLRQQSERVQTMLDTSLFAPARGERKTERPTDIQKTDAGDKTDTEESAAYWLRAWKKTGMAASASTALFSPKRAPTTNSGLSVPDPAATSSSSSSCPLPPPLLTSLPLHVDASFFPLIQALSPEILLKAFTAVLLERPVVVKSSSRTLTMVACEGLRRLIYPFAWLLPYKPLLPVGGICSFWDDVKRGAGGRSWYDYVFEEDGLDESLMRIAGRRSYAEPMTTSSAMRQVPGFLVGIETCIVDAALTATKIVSPAYSDGDGDSANSSSGCHAWACATCDVHEMGVFSGMDGVPSFDVDSPFSPGNPSPLSTRSMPLSTRGQGGHGLSPSGIATAGHAARNTSTTKYGELPPCVRASTRELLASAFIVDLDNDCVEGPRRGDPATATLPVLPGAAVCTLLTSIQQIVNPSMGFSTGSGNGDALGYGYHAVHVARSTDAKKTNHESMLRNGGAAPSSEQTKSKDNAMKKVTGNVQLHAAFVTFFRQLLLDRYREYTLSYLEEQMVAFHADSFLASQPEPTHAFWTDIFQTRLFAYFLLVEHQRVAASFREPNRETSPDGAVETIDV